MSIFEFTNGATEADIPTCVREFSVWLERYVEQEGLANGKEYTWSHFKQIAVKAREFGLVIDQDGSFTVKLS